MKKKLFETSSKFEDSERVDVHPKLIKMLPPFWGPCHDLQLPRVVWGCVFISLVIKCTMAFTLTLWRVQRCGFGWGFFHDCFNTENNKLDSYICLCSYEELLLLRNFHGSVFNIFLAKGKDQNLCVGE